MSKLDKLWILINKLKKKKKHLALQKEGERKRWIAMKLTPKLYGTCEEVAHLIQACIEDPLINGENIRIDMGYRYNQEGYSQGHSKY